MVVVLNVELAEIVKVVPDKLEKKALVEVIPPTTCNPPCTPKVSIGVLELIPTLPLVRMVSMEVAAALEETIEKGFSVPLPWIVNLAARVEVPMPTLPFAKTLNILFVCAEEISKIDEVAPVEDANTDNAPLDIIPPAPTFKPVPAIIFP